jgi:hypothetical protein
VEALGEPQDSFMRASQEKVSWRQ